MQGVKPKRTPTGNLRDRDKEKEATPTVAAAAPTTVAPAKSSDSKISPREQTVLENVAAAQKKASDGKQSAAEIAQQKDAGEKFLKEMKQHFQNVKDSSFDATRKSNTEAGNKYFTETLPKLPHNTYTDESIRASIVLLVDMYCEYQIKKKSGKPYAKELDAKLPEQHTALTQTKTLADAVIVLTDTIRECNRIKTTHSAKEEFSVTTWLSAIKKAAEQYQTPEKRQSSSAASGIPKSKTDATMILIGTMSESEVPAIQSSDDEYSLECKPHYLPTSTVKDTKVETHLDEILADRGRAFLNRTNLSQATSNIEKALAEFKKCSDQQFHGAHNHDSKKKQALAPYMLCMLINLIDMMIRHQKINPGSDTGRARHANTAFALKKELMAIEVNAKLVFPRNISEIQKAINKAILAYNIDQPAPHKWLTDLNELVKNYTVDNVAAVAAPTHSKTPSSSTTFLSGAASTLTAAAVSTKDSKTAAPATAADNKADKSAELLRKTKEHQTTLSTKSFGWTRASEINSAFDDFKKDIFAIRITPSTESNILKILQAFAAMCLTYQTAEGKGNREKENLLAAATTLNTNLSGAKDLAQAKSILANPEAEFLTHDGATVSGWATDLTITFTKYMEYDTRRKLLATTPYEASNAPVPLRSGQSLVINFRLVRKDVTPYLKDIEDSLKGLAIDAQHILVTRLNGGEAFTDTKQKNHTLTLLADTLESFIVYQQYKEKKGFKEHRDYETAELIYLRAKIKAGGNVVALMRDTQTNLEKFHIAGEDHSTVEQALKEIYETFAAAKNPNPTTAPTPAFF